MTMNKQEQVINQHYLKLKYQICWHLTAQDFSEGISSSLDTDYNVCLKITHEIEITFTEKTINE